jgi:hypothetical protein
VIAQHQERPRGAGGRDGRSVTKGAAARYRRGVAATRPKRYGPPVGSRPVPTTSRVIVLPLAREWDRLDVATPQSVEDRPGQERRDRKRRGVLRHESISAVRLPASSYREVGKHRTLQREPQRHRRDHRTPPGRGLRRSPRPRAGRKPIAIAVAHPTRTGGRHRIRSATVARCKIQRGWWSGTRCCIARRLIQDSSRTAFRTRS